MSSMDRFVRWLTGEEENAEEQTGQSADQTATHSAPESTRAASRTANDSGLPGLVSNAQSYGVTAEAATVAPGTSYWRLTRIHHLSPQENGGRHHLYLDALKADGSRAFNSQALITWNGGEQVVTVDKPVNEPGTNFPMFKFQTCSVEMRGMPSDKAHGISSSHPDEPNPDGSQSGNTLFHHSFLVIFQEVTAPQTATTGAIQGRVENGHAGLTVELLQGERLVASAPVAADGTFTFPAVTPGDYTVRLGDQSIPAQVQAGKTVQVALALVVSESVIEGTVAGGAGLILRLVEGGEVIAEGPLGQSGAFRLRNLGPGIYHVQLLRAGESEPLVKSGALAMDGRNQRTVELVLPAPPPVVPPPAAPASSGSPLDHYVLFPAADQPETGGLLAALLPHLAAKGLAFGFDPKEAERAKKMTVVTADSTAQDLG